MAASPVDTVPPQRLGTLLAEARVGRSRSLQELAATTPFDAVELSRIEAGTRGLTAAELPVVCAAYGVTSDALVPGRAQVSVDLEARELVVAEATVRLTRAPTADDVLSAYLGLVYSLRRARHGSPIVLREFDLAVLARGLDLARPEVDRRLRALMVEVEDPAPTARRRRRRRRRVAIVVGSLLALAGIVLGVRARRTDAPAPVAPTASSTIPPATLIPPATVTDDGVEVPLD